MAIDTNTASDGSSLAQAHKQSSDHLFTFDGGDVVITATFQGQKVTGKVAAQAMVLASPVWKKFIFPPWEVYGGDDTRPKTLDFTEDDGCALLILLRLAHLQFTLVPTKVPARTLSKVAVLCEKYGCIKLAGLWLQSWMQNIEAVALEDSTGRWLYIAWAFGRKDLFDKVAIKCTREFRVTDGKLFTSAGSSPTEPMPEQILEGISKIREDTLKCILDVIYKEIAKYENSVDTEICYAKVQSCDALVYGSLLLGLKKIGLLPVIKCEQFMGSIDSLVSLVSSVLIHRPPNSFCRGTSGRQNALTHHQCAALPYLADVNKIVADIPSPALECHIRHMEAVRSSLVPPPDPLIYGFICFICSQTHSAMTACGLSKQ